MDLSMADVQMKWYLLCTFYVRADSEILPPEVLFIDSLDVFMSCEQQVELSIHKGKCVCYDAALCTWTWLDWLHFPG